jgi:hypothetical protein
MRILFLLPLLFPPFAPKQDALALFRQWRRSPSAQLRIQAARALRGHVGPESRVALLSLLGDEHVGVRAAARAELVRRAPGEGPDLAREVRALRDPRARLEGVRAILARKEDLTLFADDPAEAVRARALASGRVATPALREAWKHRDGRTRALALECLGDPELVPRAVRDRAEQVRIAAARVATTPEPIAELLGDRSWRVRLAAVHAAERLRHRDLVAPLIAALGQPPGRVHARTVEALERITRAGFGADQARWRSWWRLNRERFEMPEPRPRRKEPGHTTAALTFRRIPVTSRRLCFILDASRSMNETAPGGGGLTRWQVVVRDLHTVLERLPKGAFFNVILFRTGVEAWRKRLVPATPGARRSCLEWIGEAKPGGWTNLFDALALALEDDKVDALYVLTDGVPSRGAQTRREGILAEMAFLNRYRLVQVNCIQAGSDKGLGKKWRGFLDDLAESHDGISVRD